MYQKKSHRNRQDFIFSLLIHLIQSYSIVNALHTNSCLHLAKVKVIKVICKAKSRHAVFLFLFRCKNNTFCRNARKK